MTTKCKKLLALLAFGCTIGTAAYGTTYLEYTDHVRLTRVTTSASYYTIAASYYGKPVTGVEGGALFECTSIVFAEVPDSVSDIGSYAFERCAELQSVILGSGVTVIQHSAFARCNKLKYVLFKGDAPWIGDSVFADAAPGCVVYVQRNAEGFDMDANGKWQGMEVRYYDRQPAGFNISSDLELTAVNLDGATEVAIPAGITNIGYRAFLNCAEIESVIMPDSVTRIDNEAFYGCAGLREAAIPSKVESIGKNAFRGCRSLGSLTIPDSVTSIEAHAFQACAGLERVVVGKGVASIGDAAFAQCTSLKQIKFTGDAPSLGSMVFTGVPSDCVCMLPRGNKTYAIALGQDGSRTWSGRQVEFYGGESQVRLDPDGGYLVDPQDSVVATYGSAMPAIIPPERRGYTFGGYFDGKDGAGTKYYYSSGKSAKKWDKGGDATLYAKWTPAKYEYRFNNSFSFFGWADSSSAALYVDDGTAALAVNKNKGTVKITTGAKAPKYTAFSTTTGTYAKFYKIGITAAQAKANAEWIFSCKLAGSSGKCGVFLVEYGADKKIIKNGTSNYRNLGWVKASAGSYVKNFTVSANCRAVQFFFDNGQANSAATFSDIYMGPADTGIPSIVRMVRTYDEFSVVEGLPEVPEKAGYTGVSWTCPSIGEMIGGDLYEGTPWIAFNVNFTPRYEPKTSRIQFEINDGTGILVGELEAAYGERLPDAPLPVRYGYTFGGYFDAPTGGTKYYYSTGKGAKRWDKDTDSATLYARWTPVKCTVVLDNQGATTKGTASVTATYGAALPAITVPTKTGYNFAGYFDGKNGTGIKYYYSSGKSAKKWDKGEAATLYARWTKAKATAKTVTCLAATCDDACTLALREPILTIEEGVLVAVEPNGLTEIEVPDTVTIIGEAAFVGCTEVERVVLPETVEVIGEFAFFGCAALEELVLPTGELEVSATAFLGCPGLADEDGTVTIDGIPFDCQIPLK